MKTKKVLIAVLTAALVTAFIIGCDVLSDITNLDTGTEQSAPDGKVNVRINVGNSKSNARTILPTTDDYNDPGDFAYFLLFVHDDTANSNVSLTSTPFNSYFQYSAFTNSITLTAAHYYTFTVFACNNNAGNATTRYMAWGASESTEINNNTSDAVNIELKEIIGTTLPGTWSAYDTDGTFSWNPNVSAYEIALLTLTSVKTGLPVVGGVNGLDLLDNSGADNDGSIEIPSGYYTLVLQLGKEDHQTVNVREMVHIWSGLETIYAPPSIDLPVLRSTLHTVTFDYTSDDQGVSESRPRTKTITHALSFSAVLAKPIPAVNTTPVHTDPLNNYFDGWFTDNTPFNHALVPAALVVRDATLYAKWMPKGIPVPSDFDITKNEQYNDDPIEQISIEPKDGKSDGAITKYYDGGAFSSAPGTYTVTFDVGDGTKYKAVAGLAAGTLIIHNVVQPTKANFNISKTTQSSNHIEEVSILAKSEYPELAGKVSNITYTDGSDVVYTYDTLPATADTYTIKFNVTAVHNKWLAATQIDGGTLTVKAPEFFNLTVGWTKGDLESIISPSPASYATYDEVLDKLHIHVVAATGHVSYKWYADDDLTETPLGDSSNVLDITINDVSTTDWYLPGTHYIWLETGSNRSEKFSFPYPPPTGP